VNVVFIPNVKNGMNNPNLINYDYSIKGWKKWCDKNGCELFVLEDTIFPIEEMKITWQRYYVFDLLENAGIDYENVLMVDADTFVHPECPNFFNMMDDSYVGVHNYGSYDWIIRSIEIYQKYFFQDINLPFYEYINGGFQVFNKKHKQFFQDVLNFYFTNKDNLLTIQNKFGVGTDQTPINFLLRKHNVDLKLLPHEYNMCDMIRREVLDEQMTFSKIGWIYHFCAIPGEKSEFIPYWLEKCYKYFYGE
jgi:hypothetical protein